MSNGTAAENALEALKRLFSRMMKDISTQQQLHNLSARSLLHMVGQRVTGALPEYNDRERQVPGSSMFTSEVKMGEYTGTSLPNHSKSGANEEAALVVLEQIARDLGG